MRTISTSAWSYKGGWCPQTGNLCWYPFQDLPKPKIKLKFRTSWRNDIWPDPNHSHNIVQGGGPCERTHAGRGNSNDACNLVLVHQQSEHRGTLTRSCNFNGKFDLTVELSCTQLYWMIQRVTWGKINQYLHLNSLMRGQRRRDRSEKKHVALLILLTSALTYFLPVYYIFFLHCSTIFSKVTVLLSRTAHKLCNSWYWKAFPGVGATMLLLYFFFFILEWTKKKQKLY